VKKEEQKAGCREKLSEHHSTKALSGHNETLSMHCHETLSQRKGKEKSKRKKIKTKRTY
jgi:hypothetical protein